MDPLGALIRLSEVTLLTDTGRGVAAALEPPNAPTALPIGKLVTAQVVDANSTPTLVSIGGTPYALNIPFAVRAGQVLSLQVSEVTPALQFRLLATSEAPLAQDPSVGLAAFHPDANVAQGSAPQGSAPQANVTAANAAPEPFPAPPLVSAVELTVVPDLGNLLTAQIKRQFEGQMPDLAPKMVQQAIPVPIAPPTTRGETVTAQALPVALAPALSAAVGASLHGASTEQALAAALTAAVSAGPIARPNPVASTLEPASWNGPIWSGQNASITIEPDQRRTPFAAPALNRWNATLRLTLPNLGLLNARVDWSTPGLSIRIAASDSDSAHLLRSHSGELVDTLRSLEMRIQAVGVSHGE